MKRLEHKRKAEQDAKAARDGGKRQLLASSRVIKFSNCQKVNLYMHRLFDCLLCCSPCTNSKLWKLYNKGQERIEKQLDIVKIVQRLNHMKIITNRLVENGTIKIHELYANNKNIIYIDSSDEEKKLFDTRSTFNRGSKVNPTSEMPSLAPQTNHSTTSNKHFLNDGGNEFLKPRSRQFANDYFRRGKSEEQSQITDQYDYQTKN